MTAATLVRERTLRVAIYTRVSEDQSGRERSPAEQESENRRVLDREREPLEIVGVYRDLIGASDYTPKHKGDRTDWLRLQADMAAGRIDAVSAYLATRLTRRLDEFAELANACREYAVRLLVDGKWYDLANPSDAYVLGLDVLNGQRQVAETRMMSMRALAANLEDGMPHGRIPFGYTRVEQGRRQMQVPDVELAPVVRELFERFARGESLRSLSMDLDRRGIRTPTPPCPPDCDGRGRAGKPHKNGCNTGKWGTSGPSKVRQILSNPTYIAVRTHRNVQVGPAAWEPLVDVELFERAQAILADPRRRTAPPDTRLKHLLPGLLSCGVCGGYVGQTTVGGGHARAVGAEPDERIRVYRCKQGGHVARKQDVVDKAVAAAVVARLSSPDAIAAWSATGNDELRQARQALSELRARLSDADDALADGKLSAAAFGRLESRLQPRIAVLEETVRALDEPLPLAVELVAGDGAERRWLDLPPGQQRALIATVAPSLRLLRIGRNTKLADGLAGVGVTWRGETTEHEI